MLVLCLASPLRSFAAPEEAALGACFRRLDPEANGVITRDDLIRRGHAERPTRGPGRPGSGARW